MAGPLRVVLSGAGGRMGRALAGLIDADSGLEIAGAVDRTPPDADLLRAADALIDFSAPAFLAKVLAAHAAAGATSAIVVGTTGLGAEDETRLADAAARAPVLTAANFSVAVNLLLSLAEQAARVLGDSYDVEIVEAHHRRKEDAPSGTALALGAAVAAGLGTPLDAVRRDGRSGRPGARPAGEIGFHSVRGGELAGEHQLLFLGDLDRVELIHRATDRTLFAAGALRAARWLAGRPAGRYSMRDVLGLA